MHRIRNFPCILVPLVQQLLVRIELKLLLQLNIEFVDKITGVEPDYDEDFHIRKLYNNFKSEVEEVIWRSRIYSSKMVEAMQQSGLYYLKPQDVNRYIIGNYDREEDIMKRPLAKLTQDIAKQIGLL